MLKTQKWPFQDLGMAVSLSICASSTIIATKVKIGIIYISLKKWKNLYNIFKIFLFFILSILEMWEET